MAAEAGWGGTWAITEEEVVEVAEVGCRWARGRMDTEAFAEEEAPDREEGRLMGDGWATEAYRAGSGGGESEFPMDRVGGGMAGAEGEGTDREGLGAKEKLDARGWNSEQQHGRRPRVSTTITYKAI